MFKSEYYTITDDNPEIFFTSPNKIFRLVFTLHGEVLFCKGKEVRFKSNTWVNKKDEYGNLKNIIIEFHPNSNIYVYYEDTRELIWSSCTLESLKTNYVPKTNITLQIYDNGIVKFGGNIYISSLPDFNRVREKLEIMSVSVHTVDDLKNVKLSARDLNKLD